MKVKFYVTMSGRNPVLDFLKNESEEIRTGFTDAVERLEAGKSLAMPLSRSVKDLHKGLFEMRLHDAVGEVRVFYLLRKRDAIWFLHAFRKKTRTTSKREKRVVLNRIRGGL